MLVKFGRKGQEVREYFIEDGSRLEDLIGMLDINIDSDDIIHDSTQPNDPLSEDDFDYELEEGACYVLESVELTSCEIEIINLLEGVCVEDMYKANQRILIQKIVKIVNENIWDK